MQRLRSRVIPGRLHPNNQGTSNSRSGSQIVGAVAWGCHGLLAFACHSSVILLDSITMDPVQSLDGHTANVSALCWGPDSIDTVGSSQTHLRLITGDQSGVMLLWSAGEGKCLARIADSTFKDKPVQRVEWHPDDEDLFIALHSPSTLSLWNARSFQKLWKIDVSAPQLLTFMFNPFDSSHLAAPSPDNGVYFSQGLAPSSSGSTTRKYNVFAQGTGKEKKEADQGLRQSVFSPHARNRMLFVQPREVMIFDTSVHMPIASLFIDSSRPMFAQVFFSKIHPLHLFGFHDDGSLSVWVKNSESYTLQGFHDLLRTSFHSKVVIPTSLTVVQHPIDDLKFALANEDGRVWFWELSVSATNIVTSTLCGQSGAVSGGYSSVAIQSAESPFPARIAVGTRSGAVQVFDLSSGQLLSEHTVHQSSVRGLRWESPSRILSFAYSSSSASTYSNEVVLLDLRDGRRTVVRDVKDESAPIGGIRLSSARQYLLVLLKDKPTEIWDMRRLRILQAAFESIQITAVEFGPYSGALPIAGPPHAVVKEEFVLAASDGSVRHFSISDGIVSSSPRAHIELQSNVICSMAWGADVLICGDTVGNVHAWSFRTRKSVTYSVHRGLVRRIRFAPSEASLRAVIFFGDGDIGLWDFTTGQCLALKDSVKGKDVRTADIGWADDDHPVAVTTDGCVRVLLNNLSVGQSSAEVGSYGVSALLSPSRALQIKTAMNHGVVPAAHNRQFDDWPFGDPDIYDEISSSSSTARRCLLTARYFGNSAEVRFWTLVSHYLPILAQQKFEFVAAPPSVYAVDSPLIYHPKPEAEDPPSIGSPLPPHLDYLRESSEIKHEGTRLVSSYDALNVAETRNTRVELRTALGQKERALHMLLEVEPDRSINYRDALFACVLAGSMSKQSFEHTVILVATNFIAANKLDEGVQLLTAVGRSADACKYLMAHGRWHEAAWLAKVTLQDSERTDVLKRYADYMKLNKQDMKAVDIYVSLGLLRDALRHLYDCSLVEVAAMFVKACDEQGLRARLVTDPRADAHVLEGEQLLTAVDKKYSEYLEKVGYKL